MAELQDEIKKLEEERAKRIAAEIQQQKDNVEHQSAQNDADAEN